MENLTSVADNTNRWRGENEDPFPKQCQLPQNHNLLPKKLDELRHAASRVSDLQEAEEDKKVKICRRKLLLLMIKVWLSDLHLWVHAAIDGGDAPGRAGGDQTVCCRREHRLFIVVEGL